MKLAVISSADQGANFIIDEAVKQNIDVTAIDPQTGELSDNVPVIEKNVLELTKNDIEKFDVVVSEHSLRMGQGKKQIEINQHLVSIFQNTDTRLIVVGSGSNLYTDDSRKKKVKDFLPAMKEQSDLLEQAYLVLKNSQNVDWTYVAPPFHYDVDGPATGHYRLGSDYVIVDKKGVAQISYADMALAIVDEIKNKKFPKQMFTATYE